MYSCVLAKIQAEIACDFCGLMRALRLALLLSAQSCGSYSAVQFWTYLAPFSAVRFLLIDGGTTLSHHFYSKSALNNQTRAVNHLNTIGSPLRSASMAAYATR